MNNENLEIIRMKVTEALKTWPSDEITGARLGELILKIAPDINLREAMGKQTGAVVKKFALEYLDKVLTFSRPSGSDSIYSINKPKVIIEAVNIIEDQNEKELWRTFVSPNSPKRLVIQGESISLQSKTEPLEELDQQFELASVSVAEMDAIRKSYSEELLEDSSILPSLEKPYIEWLSALRGISRDAYRSWTAHRNKKLVELLEDRLNSLLVDQNLRNKIRSALQRSQSALKTNVKKPVPSVTDMATTAKQEKNKADIDLRTTILQVVQILSVAELRELKLPVGAVYDAIFSKQSK